MNSSLPMKTHQLPLSSPAAEILTLRAYAEASVNPLLPPQIREIQDKSGSGGAKAGRPRPQA
ncbi:hypothetical protein MPC4_10213 [Methylocella tundrae]|uniref:Uncharacterized protein n=1 Tax=Methylocella tundrae TaxID=227605 RepID=A0A8B6M1M8_METTU|nr:hypothetical protein MPC1_11450002 [Methylocella tundrae]VTZ48263.1 hypothetical protein MPC4_10213 [Methylocella tundrae]